MARRILRIFFYKLQTDDEDHSCLEKILFDIEKSEELKRVKSFKGIEYILNVQEKHGHYELILAKERAGGWPYLIKDGKIEQIPITNGKLGEVTCFLLLLKKKLLIQAYNYHGPTITSLKEYLLKYAISTQQLCQKLDFLPILEKESYERFLNMQKASKISFKVDAAFPGPKLIDEINEDSLVKSLRLLQETGGFSIDISISMGRSKQSLKMPAIRKIVKKLLSERQLVKLRVKGEDPETQKRVELDLLSDRLTSEIPIEMGGQYARIKEIMSAMFVAYIEKLNYLEKVLPINHGT